MVLTRSASAQVVGGWDSSNTAHLLEIPHAMGLEGYHVNVKECIRPDNSVEWRDVEGEVQVSGRPRSSSHLSCACTHTPDRFDALR